MRNNSKIIRDIPVPLYDSDLGQGILLTHFLQLVLVNVIPRLLDPHLILGC